MNISVGSIKACRSRSQKTPLASLKLHLYSTEAFISCTYHKTAICANIAAASGCLRLSMLHHHQPPHPTPRSHTVVERPSVFTPSLSEAPVIWHMQWMVGLRQWGLYACFCLLSVRRNQWLNYKEWCTEAAEVSCFAAEPCNENFTSKDECGASEQMVWFWILLFIGFHINSG